MKTLKFDGYSDDTFACIGPGIDVDYDTCASCDPVIMRVEAGGETLTVVGQYSINGTGGWMIGVSTDGEVEDAPIPSWPIRIIRGECDYSPRLEIDAPDDVTVELVAHGDEYLP